MKKFIIIFLLAFFMLVHVQGTVKTGTILIDSTTANEYGDNDEWGLDFSTGQPVPIGSNWSAYPEQLAKMDVGLGVGIGATPYVCSSSKYGHGLCFGYIYDFGVISSEAFNNIKEAPQSGYIYNDVIMPQSMDEIINRTFCVITQEGHYAIFQITDFVDESYIYIDYVYQSDGSRSFSDTSPKVHIIATGGIDYAWLKLKTHYCNLDAKDVIAVVLSRADHGESIYVAKNIKDSSLRQDFIDACSEMINNSNVKEGDTVIIYFSSHGGTDSDDKIGDSGESTKSSADEFLDVGNLSGNDYKNSIVDDALFSLFENSSKWNKINKLFILDACHSGGFWGTNENGGDLDRLSKIGFIAAAAEDENAGATLSGRAIFTQALIWAMKRTGSLDPKKLKNKINNWPGWDHHEGQEVIAKSQEDGIYIFRKDSMNITDSQSSDYTPIDLDKAINILIISPEAETSWLIGASRDITWATDSPISAVTIELYKADNLYAEIVSSISNSGSYSWDIPSNLPIGDDYSIKIKNANDSTVYSISSQFSIKQNPAIEILSPSSLSEWPVGHKRIIVWSSTSGISNVKIDLYKNDSLYLTLSSSSANTNSYNWEIPISQEIASNYKIRVSDVSDDTIYGDSEEFSITRASNLPEIDPPFGSFETPKDGSTVAGSIAVTGWALDDSGIDHVKIYMESGKTLVYIGDAMLVEGARPDVEAAYPDYPNNTKAGWGYMMLTNFLPNGGNGTFVLHAIATDAIGKTTTLGSKTIIVDNANAVKPFGAIDTPYQGGSASGSSYVNWGWVLTPMPNSIPTDGSTINVWVDGVNLGNPNYNIYREDIARLFPGYANTNGAVGYFFIDTTAYDNGVHTIQWTAKDTAGNTDGIGSRYFSIQNTANDALVSGIFSEGCELMNRLAGIPADDVPIYIKKGFRENGAEKIISSKEYGIFQVNMRELEPISLGLQEGSSIDGCYQQVGKKYIKMPPGMTIRGNKISWMPGLAFLGNYRFVVLIKDENGNLGKKYLNVTIEPKFKRMK